MTNNADHITQQNNAESNSNLEQKQNNTSSNPSSNPRWHGFSIFVMFIALVGLIGLGGVNYLSNQKLQSNLEKLARSLEAQENLNNNSSKLLELTTADNQILNNEITQVKAILSSNKQEIKNLEQAFADLSKIKQDPNTKIKLLNIENLLNTADRKLKLDIDLNATNKLLDIAQQSLKTETQPELINLRKKILMKQQQLSQIQLPDLVKIAANLDELARKIDNITLLDLMTKKSGKSEYSVTSQVNTLGDTPDNTTSYSLSSAFSNIKNDILELVRIRKLNDQETKAINKLLDEEQIVILKLYLKLKVTQAIISLQNYEQENYNSIISDLDATISKYFAANPEYRQELLSLLDKTVDLNISVKLPDLTDLYSVIKRVA